MSYHVIVYFVHTGIVQEARVYILKLVNYELSRFVTLPSFFKWLLRKERLTIPQPTYMNKNYQVPRKITCQNYYCLQSNS